MAAVMLLLLECQAIARAQDAPSTGAVVSASEGINSSAPANPRFEPDSFSKLDRLNDLLAQRTAAEQAQKQREAAREEYQFVNHFNHLVDAVLDFSKSYNANHTVDLNRIKALKKAWHDLEKNSGFFRAGETGRSDQRNRKQSAASD